LKGEAYVLLFLCGLGDVVTTLAGLSLGFVETRAFFFPFLATIILGGCVWLISWLPTPETLKTPTISFLVVLAFSATANNLAVLVGVHNLTLLG